MMGKVGAPINARVMMYKAILQAVILNWNEIWVVTDVVMILLEGLYHMIARRILGMKARRGDSW